MTEYDKAVQAMKWLNRNTDYRANNISHDYPQTYIYSGMFTFAIFSNMEPIGFRTGKELVEIAEREGWKDEVE